jgi:hypothetical protein
MVSVLARQNMPGQIEFVNGLLDALIAVNYAPGSSALTTVKNAYAGMVENSHGGTVFTMSMTVPSGGQQPDIDMFGVYTGAYTEAQIAKAYKDTFAFSKKFTDLALQTASSVSPGTPVPTVDQTLNENALTVDGIKFGAIVTTTKITIGGKEQVTTATQYYGVAAGNLVIASSEASLRAKLPAIVAKRPVENSIKLTLKDDEAIAAAVHGENIVEAVLSTLKLDRNDPDIQAQIKSLKDGYAAAAPVKATFNASQAKATVLTTIPYAFIAQSIRLAQFASAHQTPTK